MIRAAAPEDDGARQYYFIEQAKILWKQQFESLADSGEAAGRYESELLLRLQAEGKYGTFHIGNLRLSDECPGLREALRNFRRDRPAGSGIRELQIWCIYNNLYGS